MTAASGTLETYQSLAAKVLEEHPEIVLGHLTWYFITEGQNGSIRVKPESLARWFDDLGLDKTCLPPDLTRVNAFRKGSSEINHDYTISDKQTAQLRVIEIDYNDDMVLRHLMRNVVDKASTTVSTTHVATLRFIKPPRSAANKNSGGSYQVKILDELVEIGTDNKPTGRKFPMSAKDREEIECVLDQFRGRYADLAEHLQSQALRAMVRKILWSTNAVMCKPSGGVYFVHSDHYDTVLALQQLLARIGQGCKLVATPLLDVGEIREELTDRLADEIEVDCRKLMTKIANANEQSRSGKVPARTYADINASYQDVMSRVEDYSNKMGITQSRSGAALETVLLGLIDLSGRIDGRL